MCGFVVAVGGGNVAVAGIGVALGGIGVMLGGGEVGRGGAEALAQAMMTDDIANSKPPDRTILFIAPSFRWVLKTNIVWLASQPTRR
jgi:hypothetical protein